MWRLYHKYCQYPGHSIINTPPRVEDLCRLLGGKVQGSNCVDYYNDADKKQTCSLDDLWQGKCPIEKESSSPANESIPSEKTIPPLQKKEL